MESDSSTVEHTSLQEFEPLSSLSVGRLQELASLTAVEIVPANGQIYDDGLIGVQVVYLLEGEAAVTLREQGGTQNITAGSEEARHSLVGSRFRSAYAVTDCSVLRVDNEVLDTLLAWEQLAEAESRVAASNSEIDSGKFLNKYHKSFQQIPVANIDQMFQRVEPIPFQSGEVVIKEGDEGDFFYLIEFGQVLVTRASDEGEIELAELGEGASFGEDALLTSNPRNATVTMSSDGVLLRLSKENFLELLKEPTLNWLDPAQAQSEINSGAHWLDVRYPKEYRQSRLLDALNIPLQDIRERIGELSMTDHYIVYCNTGRRSSAAAYVMAQQGFHISALKGGLHGLRA